ncbi:MAG: uncharacterized protein JWM12_3325 [Ilumatobacteraceae bacterium]|nr:uncharacterized protein [Ilumatobacteraceae bacterium]
MIHVGCSGWVYRDWRGVVYPQGLPARRWFEWYAERFDTVELNSTFYRLPSESAVRSWAAQAPPGFVYAAKVGQFATHRKKLLGAEWWLPRHLERIRLLGDHLGPNLFQLPPHWKVNVDRLGELLALLPDDVRWAVELRDPSWLRDDVFDLLRAHDAALCIHDLLADHPFVMTATWTYVRFHGPDALREPYRGRYGARRLRPWVARLGAMAGAGGDAWCYFNNDYEGNAFRDATWLKQAVTDVA